jgi:hypothetical protein
LDKVVDAVDKNKELLEELKELNSKLNSEELQDKLSQFKQTSKNQVKTLEQLVELTKRFYVDKKANQLADKLEQLSQKQQKLALEENPAKSKLQENIKEQFQAIQEQLRDVIKENATLKSPIDLPDTKNLEQDVNKNLNDSKEELSKSNISKASSSQKKAAQSMKQLGAKIKEAMESGEREQLEEDVKMLRQVLDNLLAFSNEQEEVMKQFRVVKIGSSSFNTFLKTQQSLKSQFKHIDDSLFSMSLRNEKIAEDVTKEIGTVQYNIDNAIDKLGNGIVSKGISHQQFVVASSNKLADMLSDFLHNMQMNLSGTSGVKPKPGKGDGMQLQDIIFKQKGLGKKMKDQINGQGKPNEGGAKSGAKSSGKEGSDGEGDAKAVMEIYQQQKELRDALENELQKNGLNGTGQSALEQMKQIEKQLLNKGFKNEVLQRVLNLTQELLKLDTALQQQGQDSNRKSESNSKSFSNPLTPLPTPLKQYMNSVEILNRQSLPLHSNFNQRVKQYFNTND